MKWSLLILVTVFLSGCGKGGISTFHAPESTHVKTLFASACAQCHGDDGGGQWGLFLSLDPEGQSAELLAGTILSGREGMPAFINLTKKQRFALANYILEIRQ